MSKFYSITNPPPSDNDRGGGERYVETAGYRSARAQVAELLAAGVRLREARQVMYHFQAGETVPDGFLDPTIGPNFDLVDAEVAAVRMRERVEARLRAAQEQAEPVEPVEPDGENGDSRDTEAPE